MSATDNEFCPDCFASPVVGYGPDIRFPASSLNVWRAECPFCIGLSYSRFTREDALQSWNEGVKRKKTAMQSQGERT
jgi:hypothetical protein